jgi:hypothetical protein
MMEEPKSLLAAFLHKKKVGPDVNLIPAFIKIREAAISA